MKLRCILFLFTWSLVGAAQQMPQLQPQAMRDDFAYLRKYLETTHPMLYLHHTREAVTAKWDSLAATMNQPLSLREFYQKIAWCIAMVGCEHTTTHYGPGLDKLVKGARLLPYQLYFAGGRAYVAVNMTASRDIVPGDEVLSINGEPIGSIRRRLHQYISADGHIQTAKDQHLSSMAFNIWYFLFIEQPAAFNMTFRTKQGEERQRVEKGMTLSALNKQAVKNPVNKPIFALAERLKKFREEPLRLELIENEKMAILSVNTFVYDMDAFRRKLDSLFSIIRASAAEQLVVNLANNGGGEVELAADLLNYFIISPTSIVEYSYLLTDSDEHLALSNVPEEIRTSKYEYIDPLKDGRSMVRPSEYAGELKLLQPRTDRFTGNVYLLINGGTASAASTFAAVMKSLGLATIVGEETTGTYAGGGTVIGLDLILPNSKITAHTGLVYQRFRTTGGLAHRGVMPDIEYIISLDELLNGSQPWRQVITNLKQERVVR